MAIISFQRLFSFERMFCAVAFCLANLVFSSAGIAQSIADTSDFAAAALGSSDEVPPVPAELSISGETGTSLIFVSSAPQSDANSPTFATPPELQPGIANAENSGGAYPLYYISTRQNDQFYASGEALFLNLNKPANQPVALSTVTSQTLLTTTSRDPGYGVGMRLTVGFEVDKASSVEATYFGIDQWLSKSSVTGTNNLQIPGTVGLSTFDFIDSNRISTTSKTSLYNAEFNYLQSLQSPGISFLSGFRYLNFHDFYNINSWYSDTAQSDYRIRTQNNLFGGQLGLRLNRQWGPWSATMTSKVGVFGNVTQQKTFMADNNNSVVLRDSTTNGMTTSFIGDLNPNLSYQINSIWSLRAGYNMIWITGVARAPNQLDFTNTPVSGTSLNHNSTVFLYGANVGVEAAW